MSRLINVDNKKANIRTIVSNNGYYSCIPYFLPRQSDRESRKLAGIDLNGRFNRVCPNKPSAIQAPSSKPNTNTIVNENLYSIAATVGKDISMMRVRRAKYAHYADQHGIGAGPHIERGGCHPDRVDSNHLKSARTNSAHSMLDPETKIRNSPRCITRSTLEVGVVISRTSDSSCINSGRSLNEPSAGIPLRLRAISRNSETQRRKRLALTPFARATLAVDTPGASQALTNPRLNSFEYRPRRLLAGNFTSEAFIFPSRI